MQLCRNIFKTQCYMENEQVPYDMNRCSHSNKSPTEKFITSIYSYVCKTVNIVEGQIPN